MPELIDPRTQPIEPLDMVEEGVYVIAIEYWGFFSAIKKLTVGSLVAVLEPTGIPHSPGVLVPRWSDVHDLKAIDLPARLVRGVDPPIRSFAEEATR